MSSKLNEYSGWLVGLSFPPLACQQFMPYLTEGASNELTLTVNKATDVFGIQSTGLSTNSDTPE